MPIQWIGRSKDNDARGLANVIDASTKDCTALSDAELAELADLCATGISGYEVGFLSKEREEWVLVTHVREDNKLRGFVFSTLERIGGTPSLLLGLGAFVVTNAAETSLKAAMRDLYRRAVLAFPDEDVLVGTKMADPAAFRAYGGLTDIVPRPDHKASGEERAWGRRLAKRFGDEGQLDDRIFVIKGDSSASRHLNFSPRKPPAQTAPLAELFSAVKPKTRDSLVAFGWAMAEDLASGKLPR